MKEQQKETAVAAAVTLEQTITNLLCHINKLVDAGDYETTTKLIESTSDLISTTRFFDRF